MPFCGRQKRGHETPPVRSQWGVNLDRSGHSLSLSLIKLGIVQMP